MPVNTWTHLAVTYDQTAVRLYPLFIGGDTTFGQYFQGLIDEVRIYNRALSGAEIQHDMNTPL